jgi:hypothetical protein
MIDLLAISQLGLLFFGGVGVGAVLATLTVARKPIVIVLQHESTEDPKQES